MKRKPRIPAAFAILAFALCDSFTGADAQTPDSKASTQHAPLSNDPASALETKKGIVAKVLIRKPETVNGVKAPSANIVLTLKETKSAEFLIRASSIVEIQGFTDLNGKHKEMGGLLIMHDVQKRLEGKGVELKCRRGEKKDGIASYEISELQLSE